MWEDARFGYGLIKWLKVKSHLYNIMGRSDEEGEEGDLVLDGLNTYAEVVPTNAHSRRFFEILELICTTVTTGATRQGVQTLVTAAY